MEQNKLSVKNILFVVITFLITFSTLAIVIVSQGNALIDVLFDITDVEKSFFTLPFYALKYGHSVGWYGIAAAGILPQLIYNMAVCYNGTFKAYKVFLSILIALAGMVLHVIFINLIGIMIALIIVAVILFILFFVVL